MRPRYARWIVIAAAAVAVLVAAAGREDPEARAEEPELVLRYLFSPDADDLLVPLIDRFNGESHPLGGREIRIDGVSLTSGEAEAALADGREQAELWTPASSLWGGLLDHSVSDDWVPAENPRLVFSPQVIAMWKPLARALGWPRKKIGWSDILALTTSKDSWAAHKRPKYGKFKLGHTNPGFSTSGLSAVASHYYAVTNKQSGRLSVADVQRPEVRAAVQRIEGSIVHYGETAAQLIEKMDHLGTGYAHAVYVQETTLRGLNSKRPPEKQLVAIAPADGTFVADYPLIALNAPWVTPKARAAAQLFRRWLVPKITPEHVTENDFRFRRPAGFAELEPPKPEVLAEIQDAWHEDRTPANIVLVVDTSLSMDEGGRLDAAKQGLLSFLDELSPKDRVELVTSGVSIATEVPLGPLSKTRPAVSRAVDALEPNGNEPVYPAVAHALDKLRTLNDPDRLNAVVVLSDGAGTSGGREELLRDIEERPVTEEGTSVRIFTVAYGKGRHVEALRQIASASDGAFFPAGPSIKDVYLEIFSRF